MWMWALALIVILIGAAVLRSALTGSNAPPPQPRWRPTPTPLQSAHHWPSRGEFDFEVVGESHYQSDLAWLAARHGDNTVRALLVPESDNPFDPNAVHVEIDGRIVGYLPADEAGRFRRRLSQKKLARAVSSCDASIVGGHRLDSGKTAHYGVRLDIKTFE